MVCSLLLWQYLISQCIQEKWSESTVLWLFGAVVLSCLEPLNSHKLDHVSPI